MEQVQSLRAISGFDNRLIKLLLMKRALFGGEEFTQICSGQLSSLTSVDGKLVPASAGVKSPPLLLCG